MTTRSKAAAALAALALAACAGGAAGCAQQPAADDGGQEQEQQQQGEPDLTGVTAGLQITSPDGEIRTYMVSEDTQKISWSEGEGEKAEEKARWKIVLKGSTPSAVLGKSKVYTLNEAGKNKTVTSKGYKLKWIAHDKLMEEVGPAADAANHDHDGDGVPDHGDGVDGNSADDGGQTAA